MEDGLPETPFHIISEEPFVAEAIFAVHQTKDGGVIEGGVVSDKSLPADEIKEILAESHGSDTGSFLLGEEEIRASAMGRMVVGFRKWNSSWSPRPDFDPNMN